MKDGFLPGLAGGIAIGFLIGILIGMVGLSYPPPQYDAVCQQAFQRAYSGTDSIAIIRATSCRPEGK